MVSTETKTTVAFVVLAVGLWLAAPVVTDDELVRWVLLVGVGVVAPTAVNEWRDRSD